MTLLVPPVVILIRPQMGENIGAVARAMSNFGLEALRIVAPRDGWPNPKAQKMAAGGEEILSRATVFASFAEAMADIQVAYATTARPRDLAKRLLPPAQAAEEIAHYSRTQARCALVFGPERTGIENEELTLCDSIVTIPTSPKNPSLNLAQSAVIMGYAWQCASAAGEALATITTATLPAQTALPTQSALPAPRADMVGLFEQLEHYLDQAGYFRTEQKKPIMWHNLKTMLLRGAWNEQEIRSFRGLLRTLWEAR